jgi:ERCC4-type nuclease
MTMDIKNIKKELVILCDTREKKNQHIIKFFEKQSIKYKHHKLNVGDYSFIYHGQTFENIITIERKNSLDELCQNFTKDRERFRREFIRSAENKTLVILLIENNVYADIAIHNYKSKMHPNSLFGSIRAWKEKYNIYVLFSKKTASANYIINIFERYINKNVINQNIDI